jgi:lipopolysaccharide export system permease protein
MILLRYVLLEFLRFLVGILSLCIFLFVLFDFIHKTTRYIPRFEPSFFHIFLFYLYQLPMQLLQALPIACLLASVITMILLGRSNEITAMRAAGMSPFKIAMPLFFGGIVMSFMTFVLTEYVAPPFAKKMRYVDDVLIQKNRPDVFTIGGAHIRDGDTFMSLGEYDSILGRIARVRVVEMGENFRPVSILVSPSAYYESEKWILKPATQYTFSAEGILKSRTELENIPFAIPLDPKSLSRDSRKSEEYALSELYQRVKTGRNSGVDVKKLEIEMHTKFAFCFAAWIVSMIGLRFAFKSERSTETAKGVVLAVGIGISYWFLLSFGKAMALNGSISPVMSAWLPNVYLAGFTVFDLYKHYKLD